MDTMPSALYSEVQFSIARLVIKTNSWVLDEPGYAENPDSDFNRMCQEVMDVIF